MSVIHEHMSKYDWDRDRRVGLRDRRTAYGTRNENNEKDREKEDHVLDEPSRELNDVEYIGYIVSPPDKKVYRRNGVRINGAAA